MEISGRIERGEAEIERKNGKEYSQKCSEGVLSEMQNGNRGHRKALLFHIFGDGLIKGVMTIFEM